VNTKITKLGLIALFVSSVAAAQNNTVEFDLIGNYLESNNPIVIDNKTLTFKTGSVGLRASLGDEKYGRFHLQYGAGHSPSETATFKSTLAEGSISGAMDVRSIGYGYTYPFDIENTPFSIDFKINNVTNTHTGNNLTGVGTGIGAWNGITVDLDTNVDLTSDFTRTSLGLNYQINQQTILTTGIGNLSWEIDATAVDKTAGTERANDNGSDGFYFIESVFPLFDRATKVGYRNSKLNTTTSNNLNEIYVEVAMNY